MPTARRSVHRLLRIVIVASSAAGWMLPVVARADDPLPELKPPQKQAEMEPEEVARHFFVAFLTKDKAAIERYILPEEDSELLWQGPAVPEEARRKARQMVSTMQFKRLKAGDEVKGANGKTYTVEPQQVNEQRVLLLPVGFRFPFTLIKQADGWKVKATALIAARRDAAKSDK